MNWIKRYFKKQDADFTWMEKIKTHAEYESKLKMEFDKLYSAKLKYCLSVNDHYQAVVLQLMFHRFYDFIKAVYHWDWNPLSDTVKLDDLLSESELYILNDIPK